MRDGRGDYGQSASRITFFGNLDGYAAATLRKGLQKGDEGWSQGLRELDPLSTNDGLFLLIPLKRALVIILKRGAVEAQLALAPDCSRMVALDPPLCHKKKEKVTQRWASRMDVVGMEGRADRLL